MAAAKQVQSATQPIERFRRELDALVPPQAAIGIAVSGGPDSLALLILAAEARPLQVEAATVDHALRPESRAEAEMVAQLCERLGVPHTILTATWDRKPETAIQERARAMRYRLLGQWARERGLTAVLTAHHLDDQAETFLMRLARGAGVRGLAGMRRVARVPGGELAIVRPLLGWRHSGLEAVCAAAGVEPVQDPSNEDEQFERVRIRKALAGADWLNGFAIAESAAHLAEADGALHWATDLEWKRAVTRNGAQIVYKPTDAPRDIRRRIVRRAVLALATEGGGAELRGREIGQLLAALRTGRRATLRGVLCIGGPEWRFSRSPARRSNAAPASADVGAVEG
ncbi:MAG TPA: tRNA lysidine(34) synthetase TilS [Sphingomicrobium sp.]|nr:tRNA lysidine(34) synthetase TilS [Sphingomicrobium sp.]